MKRAWPVFLVALFLLAATGAAVAEVAPLIPRDVLFGSPEKLNPQLSPDGKYLAYLAPDDKNVRQVWIRTIGKKDDRALTADLRRGISRYAWAYDGERMLFLQDADGDENDHLFAVDLKTRMARDLTPYAGVRAQLVAIDPAFPQDVLIAMNREDRSRFDIYRIHLPTARVTFDTRNPGLVLNEPAGNFGVFHSWVADSRLQIRAATAGASDGGFDLLLREGPDRPWKTVRHWGPDEQGAAVSFSQDGRTLYFVGNHDADTLRLLALDLNTGKETVVAEDAAYDFGGVMLAPVRRTVQAVAFARDKLEWKVLDAVVAEDFRAIRCLHRGTFTVVSRDRADKTWLVAFNADDGPLAYFRYDRGSKQGQFLFHHQSRLTLLLTAMKPIAYTARDGLTIHGYLTLPAKAPARGRPAVLLVHGGPWERDRWGFSGSAQWLANRGYAVLQVNYRGSLGYGKKFLNAGNREWGGKMQDDLVDGVNWLVGEGVADPKKVAIMGGSYGGYATLTALAFTPDVFAAGVDVNGPSNLLTVLRNFPTYWTPLKPIFARRVGDLEKDQAFLKSRSPLFVIERVQAPLLIAQGARDPRVTQVESDQVVAALRKAGKSVTYVVYMDEGHGFARPQNVLHFAAMAEAFLAKHLGGRCEPVGEIKGHGGVMK